MKSLQFELWQECNSLCKYCYLGEENRITPIDIKLKSLEDIYEKICDISLYAKEGYDNLAYIGGEFFQGQLNTPEVKQSFMKLMSKTAELLRNSIIKSVWICATLTKGDQKDLYEVLDLFSDIYWSNNSSDGLWILTSYDTIGRFHIPEMEENWKYHMLNIHNKYPIIKFNTTMILTQDLIDKYLNGSFSFINYMEKYNSQIFFKQPAPGKFGNASIPLMVSKYQMQEVLPGFFPKREDFLRFLNKLSIEIPVLFDKLFNIKYRSDDLYRNFNTLERHMECNHRFKDSKVETNIPNDMITNTCGHLLQYAAYIDSDRCMICDRDNYKDL